MNRHRHLRICVDDVLDEFSSGPFDQQNDIVHADEARFVDSCVRSARKLLGVAGYINRSGGQCCMRWTPTSPVGARQIAIELAGSRLPVQPALRGARGKPLRRNERTQHTTCNRGCRSQCSEATCVEQHEHAARCDFGRLGQKAYDGKT